HHRDNAAPQGRDGLRERHPEPLLPRCHRDRRLNTWHKSALCAANTYGTEFQNQSADGQTTGTRVTLLDSIGSKRRRHSQAVAEQYFKTASHASSYGLGEPWGGYT